jgi:hypothetical protein
MFSKGNYSACSAWIVKSRPGWAKSDSIDANSLTEPPDLAIRREHLSSNELLMYSMA